MRRHTRVLMVCMVLVLSISNLAISFEGVSALPVRSVQGVCDVANATFPNGCSTAQLETIKNSSAQAALDYFKNTFELNCWYQNLVRDGATDSPGSISTIFADNDCEPDKEIKTYIYRSDGLRSDFKSIYPIEYHSAYDYWLQNCNLAEGCRDVFSEYNQRQYLIWDKNQIAARPEATRLLQLAVMSAQAYQQAKDAAAYTKKTTDDKAAELAANKKIKASGGCQIGTSNSWTKNGGSYKFKEGSRKCTRGKWGKPIKTSPSGNGSGSTSTKRTLVNRTCDLKATAMSSSFSGQNYSWTIWNNWSDGSRTVASMGSGYANSVPNGC